MVWSPLTAQKAPRSWDVFIEQQTRLIFLDVLTGETVAFNTAGERYTLLGGGVLYFDISDGQVKLAAPGGNIQQHPFITISSDAERVDWAVSSDRQAIAWTLTRRNADGALMTATFAADADGTAIREVLADGPREGLRVLPIALSDDRDELYMDVHPDGMSAAPYIQYASLFALDLATGEIRTLPGEPACLLCAAGFGGDVFLRLPPDDSGQGVEVRIYSLQDGGARAIPAMPQEGGAEAGGVLISFDGSLAVYALSQRRDDGAVRSVFMRVNLHTLEQAIFGVPMAGFVHPLGWTEDKSAILFTNERRDGTWKISLAGGGPVKVANATYLGHLRGS